MEVCYANDQKQKAGYSQAELVFRQPKGTRIPANYLLTIYSIVNFSAMQYPGFNSRNNGE
jgi:hypothetical protein